ncbi:MAG TPA: hypothetical protein PLB92_12935 [Rhodoglobus sp.]|nr:hypothetical protein [Rhodoglobus sp.]
MDLPQGYRDGMTEAELAAAWMDDGAFPEDAAAFARVAHGDVPVGLPIL